MSTSTHAWDELVVSFASGRGRLARGSGDAAVERTIHLRQSGNEEHALRLIATHAPSVPVPRLLGECRLDDEHWTLTSHEGTEDLWGLLSQTDSGAPPPPGFAGRPQAASAAQAGPALEELGRALARLHAITLPQFGLLEPRFEGPWLASARDFTRHEITFALGRCVRKGWFDDATGARISAWLEARLDVVEPDEPPALVHFDLHPGNVRVERRDGAWVLAALVDFELALGWLPELDLVALQPYLGAEDLARVLCGYGTTERTALRLELCGVLRKLLSVAARLPEDPWGRWCWGELCEQVLEQRR